MTVDITLLYGGAMGSIEATTLERIHQAARKEFLDKGFQKASLRWIVKEAGVTTGAFYGYYKSKEELLEALVGEQYDTVMACYRKAQTDFQHLAPVQQQQQLTEISGECMFWILDYMYQHLKEFQLILCHCQGTRFDHLIDEMVEIEVDATNRFVEVLEGLGQTVQEIDPWLEHMLVSGMFRSYFEVIVHHLPKEKAVGYVQKLRAFYTAGWKELLGF